MSTNRIMPVAHDPLGGADIQSAKVAEHVPPGATTTMNSSQVHVPDGFEKSSASPSESLRLLARSVRDAGSFKEAVEQIRGNQTLSELLRKDDGVFGTEIRVSRNVARLPGTDDADVFIKRFLRLGIYLDEDGKVDVGVRKRTESYFEFTGTVDEKGEIESVRFPRRWPWPFAGETPLHERTEAAFREKKFSPQQVLAGAIDWMAENRT